MKVLMTRFGGIGDVFPAAVAAKAMADRGHEVTLALRNDGKGLRQASMFDHETAFKTVDFKEVGPWKTRCLEHNGGWIGAYGLYKDYDLIVDFMNIVENNSTSPYNNVKDITRFWERSRSSNWRNWYDLHLEWCNIDPTSISDEDKRPSLKLTDDEKAKASEFKASYKKLFVIHPYASSLARSWYQAEKLVPMLLDEYEGAACVVWNPGKIRWDVVTKTGFGPLPKLSPDHLRETMVLIAASDMVVAVDTGCGHVAEALNARSLVLYSTVPAWARNKYYKYQSHIDMGETDPRFYTFSLSLGDPLNVMEGFDKLTDRERKVLELHETGMKLEDAMVALNTDAKGAELELKILMMKRESWERQQSKALSLITPEMVFKRIKEIV